jgi:AcrR family transcriptional regulator
MTIQDISDRADVNRGTFYAHFPDKYALLEQSIRDKFMRLLNQKLPDTAGWNRKHLRILVHAVLEHFQEMHGRCYPVDTVNPLFEHAVQEELCELLTHWLCKTQGSANEWPVPVETIALMTSWGIFGAAADWNRGKTRLSIEEMADRIVSVIMESAFKPALD